MSRAVRFALWDYQNGQALTAVCDTDVDAFCPKVRSSRAACVALAADVEEYLETSLSELLAMCVVGMEGLLCHIRRWFICQGAAPTLLRMLWLCVGGSSS